MPRRLGELEDAVMTRVWQWNRPVTVREVLEDLQKDRSIAYTTVMTVMDNLHQKGWVRREVDGRAYRYTSVSTRAAYSAALMNEAWSTSDNPAAALVAFFGMMSAEQREALQDAMRVVQRDDAEDSAPVTDTGPETAPDTRAVTGTHTGSDTGSDTGPDTTGTPAEVPGGGAKPPGR
ncbi:BlaI/MecI/CopY family transcriptional regulator [Streptomyces sp. NBC_00237]|uniref:BlaI/MecI/CopY family transcriptional regulator n=1 Tax=Streptomyces sp. NBC_00237 TaxID=2975687 RepID=UPI00225435C2|nr:BlaI/MecI/CopY family transcriptional regulator [Streptomyces sp. NBC_00237]MCX5207423.1 BlaI/MecI/CopY family transcriptional regulator [Streptomyces sp. NBC_00237]